ncbi:hypothetical protein CcaverHIS002_0300260 [Cutaneotrichosporon cavernicola]|uniref:Uncharacterized protein n=1 Tax=Cutaneotrichosporon cavernicola TaxID=279322 RepID=A0AA48IET1_9TREE|nr:uncharacterized protein CcaverHIS019_0300260 [Cutaneotrichosporon cavernicola]BEI82158.1 hypothetical protein CcaverHIS002_0300260 [Cutaneotrichosporon cavernicola]BEI89956.1 hypothetical protein CcaverHIS019_0300260 [Cutaneotrichosporon cavernicola]BEI97729.1 hypothetical protein CcaverHIS631_0300280 [Cutaneotrichosporon cavernicola]BEJ05506.1 hypothetical protein CcaverHIS641_0300280 [Cutaneotrichosporon cavernicola]
MDDLIATLNGGMHVSQESHDLESFKASLARALPTSHNGHRGSISMPAPSFAASFQEQPLYLIREVSPAPPYEAHTQHVPYDEDMDLETAFAGDAFAPLHQTKQEDAWAAFRPDAKSAFAFSFGDKQQPAVATFQFQMQQPQSAPQYETDEDAAEAMITDE